jgi:hypothetical protein
MDDEQLNQRIKYLVEHGGMWDDPLAGLNRRVNVLAGLVVLALAANLARFLV